MTQYGTGFEERERAPLAPPEQPPRRSGRWIPLLAVLVLAALAAGGWFVYDRLIAERGEQGPPPLITAEEGPVKVLPEEPGGMEVPNQDKLVYDTFVGDEEDHSLGTEYLVEHWLPTLDTPPAAAIVLEPTEETIAVAHKGFVWLEMEVEGRAAHGSRPDEGIDAALPLGAALDELAALSRELTEKPADPLLGHASLHVGHLNSGTAWSVYPAHARLGWERRTLPGEPEALIQDELDRVLHAAASVPGDHRVSGRIVFSRLPHLVPTKSLPVRLLQHACPEATIAGVAMSLAATIARKRAGSDPSATCRRTVAARSSVAFGSWAASVTAHAADSITNSSGGRAPSTRGL